MRARNSRLIVVLEGTKDGKIQNQKSKGGIILPAAGGVVGLEGTIGSQNLWAVVLSAGPKCTDIQDGDRVCITNGKWTESMRFRGEWFWFSDEEHVLLVDMLYRETNGREKSDANNIIG